MTEAWATVIWMGFAAIFGLLIGSFLNVCIYRLPAGITIVRGHSFCPRCKHPLQALDLVPVFSYLLLGRRCRYCRTPIASRYAKIELLTGLYFAAAAYAYRPGQCRLPDYLSMLAADELTSALYASLLLFSLTALSFSALLVWAMIIWDGSPVPRGLFAFIAVPVALLLPLQPERIASRLTAAILSALLMVLLILLRLLPESTPHEQRHFSAGLVLLTFMTGISAGQPLLAVAIIELMLIALLAGRIRRKAENRDSAKRAIQIWRSLPLQLLLIGSILFLIF